MPAVAAAGLPGPAGGETADTAAGGGRRAAAAAHEGYGCRSAQLVRGRRRRRPPPGLHQEAGADCQPPVSRGVDMSDLLFGRVQALAQPPRQQLDTCARGVLQQGRVEDAPLHQVFAVGGAGLAVPADPPRARRRGGPCRPPQAGIAHALDGARRDTLDRWPGPGHVHQHHAVSEAAQANGRGTAGRTAAGHENIWRKLVDGGKSPSTPGTDHDVTAWTSVWNARADAGRNLQ